MGDQTQEGRADAHHQAQEDEESVPSVTTEGREEHACRDQCGERQAETAHLHLLVLGRHDSEMQGPSWPVCAWRLTGSTADRIGMMQAVRWGVPLIDGAVKRSEICPANTSYKRYVALQCVPVCNL